MYKHKKLRFLGGRMLFSKLVEAKSFKAGQNAVSTCGKTQ